MDEDNSFDALMNPGEANNFFDIADLPELDPSATTAYSRTNSLWLIEFSRLIYRQEITFFNEDDTQAGLFVNNKVQCAALVFRGTLGLDDDITDAKAILVSGTAVV